MQTTHCLGAVNLREVKKKSAAPIYIAAGAWVVCTLFLPMYRLSDYLIALLVSCAAGVVSRLIFKPKTVGYVPEPEDKPKKEAAPEKEEESPYSPEVQAIIEEGMTAQREMGRLYASIQDANIRKKINEIMQVSDKIVQDAKHDESDVPQIKKFLSYYLPTTIKLLNAYDRMSDQGIEGENITGTMRNIETMLDTAITAYKKQLDSLFANQAMDIDTDIQVMNAMLAREGLSDDGFKIPKQKPAAEAPKDAGPAAEESPFGAASPVNRLRNRDKSGPDM